MTTHFETTFLSPYGCIQKFTPISFTLWSTSPRLYSRDTMTYVFHIFAIICILIGDRCWRWISIYPCFPPPSWNPIICPCQSLEYIQIDNQLIGLWSSFCSRFLCLRFRFNYTRDAVFFQKSDTPRKIAIFGYESQIHTCHGAYHTEQVDL